MIKYLIAILLFTSCNFIVPIWSDPDFVSPNDTLPVVQDTCTDYIEINAPAFISWWVNFDVTPQEPFQYHLDNVPIAPENLFGIMGDEFTIYESGQNIGGIITGTNMITFWQARIWIRDGSGAKHVLTFYKKAMYPRGCMTFAEFWEELIAHPSLQYLNFSNTGYSEEQVLQTLDFILEDCKAGNGRIDLRSLTFQVPQETIDELILRGWEVWI